MVLLSGNEGPEMKVGGDNNLVAQIKGDKMTTGDSTERERGGCLTAYLIVVSIFWLIGGFSFLNISRELTSSTSQMWAMVIGIASLVAVVFVTGIWKWKKWGVLGLFGILILNILFYLIPPTRIVNAILAFIDILIFVFLIRPVWHQME